MSEPTADPLERFHRNEPLNDELRAMRDGPAVVQQARRPAMPELIEPVNPADRAARDREYLRELVLHPGWRRFQEIQQKAYVQRRDSAIALSQKQPLENAATIANAWAELTMYHQLLVDLETLVKSELQMLEGEQTNA